MPRSIPAGISALVLSAARFALTGLVICVSAEDVGFGMAVTSTGEVRQPRNLYELAYGFEHTFANILSPDELKLYQTLSPDEILRKNPELYRRISQDVKQWTDEWVRNVHAQSDQVSAKHVADARQQAGQVESILRKHFESRGWTYRPMRVEFLPPRVFLDERERGKITMGMFIPFYPDAFFASVDWVAPMNLVLVHESLHYNKTGPDYGSPMLEGITESAARELVLKYGLLSAHEIAKSGAYPAEVKGVETVLGMMVSRSGGTREAALETLLEAYLTGNQENMIRIFGKGPWIEVMKLGESLEGWQSHKISKALAKPGTSIPDGH
jgi:hypothetical protein